MDNQQDAKTRATATYNAASDHYDDPANSFWERFGRSTVERLNLQPGLRVLDACCGSGASAIPAAEHVGANGFVSGVDLADNLLELARRKAQRHGLKNIEFRNGDILDLGLPSESFDVVVCVFGIFFVPDMEAAVRELWRLVKPRGRLAITTWGPRFFEPVNREFWNSIRVVRPDLYKGFNPWDRITEPDAVRDLFTRVGVDNVAVVAEAGTQPILSPDNWWTMVMGSGYRGTIEQLTDADRGRVRQENLDFIRSNNVRAVEANVVYAVAVRKQETQSL